MLKPSIVRGVALAAVLAGLLASGCGGGDGDGDDDAAREDAATTESSTEPTTTEAPTTAAPTTERPTTSSAPTTAPPTTTAAAPGTKPWTSLVAGECIGVLPTGTFEDVETVSCDQPHAAEVLTGIRAVSLQGAADADAAAQATCDAEVEPYAADGVVSSWILETQGTLLARAVCLAVDPSGAPRSGSLVAG